MLPDQEARSLPLFFCVGEDVNCFIHLSANPIAQFKKLQRSPLHLRFLKCTLESIPCVNDTVIYGTMYQVRKQMSGGYIRFAMMVLAMMPDKVARRAPGRVYLVFWTLAAM